MTAGKLDFSKGTRVVYPNQGVCRVVGQVEMTIGGQKATFLKLVRENDDGTVMIPLAKLQDVGVRRVADEKEIAQLFKQLSAPDLGPDLNWKTRHKSHGERMAEGGVFAMADVVKELAALSDLRPLPIKERELYDNARHLLVSEIAAALGIPETSAEDAIDFALFPPGVERKKLAALLLEELAGLDDGDLDLDEALLEGADTLDGLDDGDGDGASAEEGEGEDLAEVDDEAPKSKPKSSKLSAKPEASAKKAAASKKPSKSKSTPKAKAAATETKPAKKAPAKPAKKAVAKEASTTSAAAKPAAATKAKKAASKKEKSS
ncbi:MAG: transcriptional regulator [Myxococcales bacterium]|jgi:RNA polymerase-interacting CarD/CdnL/TRCF family regulator|nr:transcriptional regulator [Myxococcales bacterium]